MMRKIFTYETLDPCGWPEWESLTHVKERIFLNVLHTLHLYGCAAKNLLRYWTIGFFCLFGVFWVIIQNCMVDLWLLGLIVNF